eukprot:gnl/MRDRNA2_/MRDRNA2_105451_c0_seq1.p1 gnl/MRDRNA2_/MRDRNA2_105451_c0~~gnl/MRDRNA2_/MRDRNA2_105451_c0_seq1.p1  ORF type:complete len:755 (+),score=125.58 gnl/MRDRNA2_/MRDRNA2_105451_c0_seq1:85-2349(+)
MGCDQKIRSAVAIGACSAMPDIEDPVLSLMLKSQELDLDFEISLPVKVTQSPSFHGLLASFAAAVPSEVAVSEKQASNLKGFDDALQTAFALRDERHAFYAQVQKNFDRLAETLAHMKRDYYREVDHLRAQISLSKRDPDFQHDNVFFFDPAAYQIPSWTTVVEQLDDRRMQRELLVEQGGISIRNVPLHMLCQNCRNRFQHDPIHAVEVATQTQAPIENSATNEEKEKVDKSSSGLLPNVADSRLEGAADDMSHSIQSPNWEQSKSLWPGWDNKIGPVELCNQVTQTDSTLLPSVRLSGCDVGIHQAPCSPEALSSSEANQAIDTQDVDSAMGVSGMVTAASGRIPVQSNDKINTLFPTGPGQDVAVKGIHSQGKKRTDHGAKALDTPSRSTFGSHAPLSVAQQCFNAWKSHATSHVASHIIRRRSTSKNAARQLVKRQLAAIEAHIKRMAFVGWRHAALGQHTRAPGEQSRQPAVHARAPGDQSKLCPAEQNLKNKVLGSRPASEPSISSNARHSTSEPMLTLGIDQGSLRPSSEPTLVSRGEHRLRNLPQSGMNDLSELSGYGDAPSGSNVEPAVLSSDGRAPLRQQFWGADDVEDWRNERRRSKVDRNQQHALEKMTKTYMRRGASVPNGVRSGGVRSGDAGMSLQQRVPVQLTLQHLDVDISVSNVRRAPVGAQPESSRQEDDVLDLLQQQGLRSGIDKKGLSHVASLPAFVPSTQRSPTQSPPPLLSKHGRALHGAKGILRRLPYASN